MRDSLHLTLVKRKGGFEKCLAVSRGARTDDMNTVVHLLLQLADGFLGGLDRIALIICIE